MTKYIIEGNIDFFNELNSIQEHIEVDTNNVCLITNEILDENYIELECGHKFNYLPLLKDVLNHKQKYNNLESKKEMLHKSEMRCPYCRYKQHKLLPYMESIFADKINGVNYYDPNLSVCEYCNDNENKCCYTYTFAHDNDPIQCNKHGSKIWLSNNYGDNNSYCSYHKKIVIKSYIVKEKQKAKEEVKQQAKEAKLKAKEDAKKAKEEAKLKAKEDAKKAKEEAKLKAKEDAKKAKEETKQKEKEEKIKSKGDDKMV